MEKPGLSSNRIQIEFTVSGLLSVTQGAFYFSSAQMLYPLTPFTRPHFFTGDGIKAASRPALVAGAARLQVVADAERAQAGIWQSTQDSTGHARRAAMIH